MKALIDLIMHLSLKRGMSWIHVLYSYWLNYYNPRGYLTNKYLRHHVDIFRRISTLDLFLGAVRMIKFIQISWNFAENKISALGLTLTLLVVVFAKVIQRMISWDISGKDYRRCSIQHLLSGNISNVQLCSTLPNALGCEVQIKVIRTQC